MNLKATIIKGNPKYILNNPIANKFYNDIKMYLETKGYEVIFDTGNVATMPKETDLWIGHSMGIQVLNRCKSNTRLLAIGVLPKEKYSNIIIINHPADELYLRGCLKNHKYDTPIDEHYIFTDDMKAAIDKMTMEIESY